MTPERRAAASTLRSTASSWAVGAVRPGSQFDVTRTAVKPASRSCAIFALAVTRSGERTMSSAAPSDIVGPAACAGSASARTAAIEPRMVTRNRIEVGVR